MPPYGNTTLLCAGVIALVVLTALFFVKSTGGRVGLILGGLLTSILMAVLVETHGASKLWGYDFGDHILEHLFVAVAGYVGSVPIIGGAIWLLDKLGKLDHAAGTHALGLLNFVFPVLGTVAIAIRWALNAKTPERAWACKQAFTLQAFFSVLAYIPAITGSTEGVVGLAFTFALFVFLPVVLVLTIMGILGARKSWAYSYPGLGSLLGAPPVVDAPQAEAPLA